MGGAVDTAGKVDNVELPALAAGVEAELGVAAEMVWIAVSRIGARLEVKVSTSCCIAELPAVERSSTGSWDD